MGPSPKKDLSYRKIQPRLFKSQNASNSQKAKSDYILHLKVLNDKLRSTLKEFNFRLERVLDKVNAKQILAQKKIRYVPIEHQIEVADKEIENAEHQLFQYRNEAQALEEKLSGLIEVNEVVDLEELVKEREMKGRALVREIKDLEQLNQIQGNELARIETGEVH